MNDIEWSNLTAPELRALSAEPAIVVVPVGATEQHGPHLPVQVDAFLAGEIARRAARLAAGDDRPVLVTPAVWIGLSEHHMAFGGTFTLDFQTFAALLGGICRSIARHGFRRIFLLNGHGGNMTALDVIAAELSIQLQLTVAAATYWMLADKEFAGILETQPNVLHACEAETSMLLALRPDLVDGAKLAEIKAPAAESFWQDFMRAPSRWRSWREVTQTGVLGHPEAASVEKGRRLVEAAAQAVARALSNEALWGVRSPA